MNKKILLVYATKKGTTGDAAAEIADKLMESVDIYHCGNKQLKKDDGDFIVLNQRLSLEAYDLIIIGTPMYMGGMLNEVKKFCNQYMIELQKLGFVLFTCGVGSQQEDSAYLKKQLPSRLINSVICYRHLGGEIRENKLNWFEKMAMKEYVKQHGPVRGIDHDEINRLCLDIKQNIR